MQTPLLGNTGQYAMMVTSYPGYTDGSFVYDPSTASTLDLVKACQSATVYTMSPAYSFAGYCYDDISMPDAYNPDNPYIIPCPKMPGVDKQGRQVTVPGIVCVQGSDTSSSQF